MCLLGVLEYGFSLCRYPFSPYLWRRVWVFSSGVADSMGHCPLEFIIDLGLNHNKSLMLINFEPLFVKYGEQREQHGLLLLKTCHEHDFHPQQLHQSWASSFVTDPSQSCSSILMPNLKYYARRRDGGLTSGPFIGK